jgi:hypothetical protein
MVILGNGVLGTVVLGMVVLGMVVLGMVGVPFFFIVTNNIKTQLFHNFCYLAKLLLSGGYGFRKI